MESKVDFITSAFSTDGYPNHQFPEVAFSGRSNVGKSSLINMVLGRKKVARTSSTPGRTRSINFFNIGDRYCLVDLPGYGYAKVPQKIKASWNELIDHYLHYRKNLKGVVQIVDARHKPSDEDLMMIDWLKATDIEYIIAATKVDKLKNKDLVKQKKKLPEQLGVETDKIVYTSAKEGTGRKQVIGFIDNVI